MHRIAGRFALIAIALMLAVFPAGPVAPVRAAQPAASIPRVGSTVLTAGFAVTLMAVARAHEAGAADYVAGTGHIFLFATVRIMRQGSHDSYTATPLDFEVETSSGDAIDSEEFGVPNELVSRPVGKNSVTTIVGFEVPARDTHMQLLWLPSLPSNPDAQSTWFIGTAGKIVQYLP